MAKRLDELGLTDEIQGYTGRIKTARGRLAAFLAGLTPKFRRLLLGEGMTGWETLDWSELTEQERLEFDAALETYHQLLASVVQTAKRRSGQQTEVLEDFAQLSTGKLHWPVAEERPRRGAPIKRLWDRLDVRRALLFHRLVNRLGRGYRRRDEINDREGHKKGDDKHIRPELRSLNYEPLEITTILRESTLSEAAYALIEKREKLPRYRRATLRASVSRGRKLIEANGGFDAVGDNQPA